MIKKIIVDVTDIDQEKDRVAHALNQLENLRSKFTYIHVDELFNLVEIKGLMAADIVYVYSVMHSTDKNSLTITVDGDILSLGSWQSYQKGLFYAKRDEGEYDI